MLQLQPTQARHKRNRLILPFLAGVLIFTGPFNTGAIPTAHAASTASQAAVTYKLVQQSETIVTSGVRQISYAWVPSDKTKATEMLHVLQVDLQNPYVQLNAMGGQKGSVTSRQSIGAMTKETGAIAGINGDVFRTASGTEGVSMGAQITSGQLLVSTEKLQGMYAFGVTKDRQPIIDNFVFTGAVTAADGVTTFPLAGLNKSAYRTEPDKAYSHVNALYMYTNAWTASERPANSAATPTEALVVDGIVTEISVTGAIQTAIPANGYILRGHGTAANFIKTSLFVGDRIDTTSSLQSADGKSYDPASFQMMVSGHTLLLNNGAAVPFTRDISGVSGSADRARTAVGYSKDGTTAYLLTVEENGGREGVTLKELQQMLVELGVWKAVNMDGGGSTTMVSRPLGEFQTQLTHPTFYGTTQRQVTNGIGVYTTAPQGTLKGIVASGARTLFMGQQATYSLKAYDSYYNPIDPNGLQPTWSLDKQLGAFVGGTFTASKPGSAMLQVNAGGNASDSIPIEIIGEAQVSKLLIEPNTAVLKPGAVISMQVKAQLTDGRQLNVPASSVTWEFRGFTATSSDGKITVNKVLNNIAAGYAIARYDGFGAVAVLAPGTERALEDFENVSYNVGFSATPIETVGAASIMTGIPGRETSKVLAMDYDFTVGSGKRFANAVLNNGKGITIEGTPSSLSLDVLGDQSMHWLRAEFTDVNGKTVYATIADQIDWAGWKNFRVDLAAAGLKGTSKLTKLYIVNKEEDQDERAMQGQLAFDNLTLQYPPDQIAVAQPTIVMTVGKKQATVDGKKTTLPGAPFVQKGTNTNYLPLRFVADSLGAQVVWNNKAKRVTVLRGDKMLELWVGSDNMTVNGVRQPITVAPMVIKGSVYVPVRVISEQLGQKVDWESKTKTITIH